MKYTSAFVLTILQVKIVHEDNGVELLASVVYGPEYKIEKYKDESTCPMNNNSRPFVYISDILNESHRIRPTLYLVCMFSKLNPGHVF